MTGHVLGGSSGTKKGSQNRQPGSSRVLAGVGSEEGDREEEAMEATGREGQGAGDLEAPRAVCPVFRSAEKTGEHTRPTDLHVAIPTTLQMRKLRPENEITCSESYNS